MSARFALFASGASFAELRELFLVDVERLQRIYAPSEHGGLARATVRAETSAHAALAGKLGGVKAVSAGTSGYVFQVPPRDWDLVLADNGQERFLRFRRREPGEPRYVVNPYFATARRGGVGPEELSYREIGFGASL
jgi:hypothetical protein